MTELLFLCGRCDDAWDAFCHLWPRVVVAMDQQRHSSWCEAYE